MKKIICLILCCLTHAFYGQIGPVPSFFNIQRATPLLDLNTTSTISVADYGAIPNDGNNDLVAITNAINVAKNLGSLQNPVRLLFESGTYNLMLDATVSHAIDITDATGILWDGQGAEFLIHNPSVGFLGLTRCTNFVIKNISIDYVTLPFTQGKITAINTSGGFFDFELDEGYPIPTAGFFVNADQRWGMIKNVKGGIKKGSQNLVPHTGFTFISGRTYRTFQQNQYLNAMAIGDYFVPIARNNGRTLIRNTAGKNVTYFNVVGYASPAGGFNAFDCEEWNVINSQIKIKEGRVHSINADCMHVNGGKIAPWVENSLFEGFADDCMNLKYTKRVITIKHSPTEYTVRGRVLAGEKMEFYNPVAGTYLGEANVTNVQILGGNLFRITLSNAINITNITDPDHQLADKAYIESQSNQSFIFRNNIVRNSRRYGLLIQNKYALIENNLFQNTSSSGIRIENGVDWGEGFRATDIVINNNTFENCGFDTSFINEANSASITVDFHKLGQPCTEETTWCGTQTTNWKAHSNIQITNNRIIYNKKGVYLKNIEGLVFTNNFICHNGQDITLGNNEQPVPQTILNSSNVTVVDYNDALPSPNLHFVLNEFTANSPIVNSGSDSMVGLNVNTSGGTITQGYFDNEVGYSVNVNTNGNGSLILTDNSTDNSFFIPTGGNARTYTFWVKPTEGIFQTLLFSGGPAVGEVFAIQMLANGVVRVTDNNANTIRMNDLPLDIGAWNHIAVSVPEDATMSEISLYKNGVPSNETLTGNNVRINTSDNNISFFTNFKGVVSDIRYFDYALCNGDVESVYNDRYITLSNNNFDEHLEKIIIHPTITSNILNFSKPIDSVVVFDITGKIVFSKSGSEIENINVSHLNAGFYLLKINNAQTTKFIKK